MKLSANDMLGMPQSEIDALTGEGADAAMNATAATVEGAQAADTVTAQAADAAAATEAVAAASAATQANDANTDAATAAAALANADAEALRQVADEPTDRPYVPQFDGGDITKIGEQLEQLTATKNDAFAKLMNGEITPEAYAKTEGEVATAREALTIAKTLHTANAQAAENYQQGELKKLMAQAKAADGLDYATPKAAARFDAEMSILANDPDWQNRDFTDRVAEAHKNVLAVMGKKPAPAPAPAPVAAAPAAAPLGPRTLSGLPTAAPAGTGGDPIMDKFLSLQGDAAERFLASQSPAEVERLMRSTVH